jgi:methionyl aminopeptidase
MLDKKTPEEIKALKEGGQILGKVLRTLASQVRVGVTGRDLNQQAEKLIKEAGGSPSFKNYNGFPAGLCVSINETVVHGIPSDKPFKEGDLVGLDLGMKYKGLYTDTATTVAVGKVSKEAEKLLKVTRQALEVGISEVGPNKYIGDIGRAIEKFIKPHGYSIVRDLAGHGVGRAVHEDPIIPNYDAGGRGEKMFPGLVLAIEPMIILGKNFRVVVGNNKWDVNSQDGTLTAHFEHTIAVTEDGSLIITK